METKAQTSFFEILDKATKLMLNESHNLGGIYEAVRELSLVYAEHSGVSAGNITDDDILLPSGNAVSPVKAAHCLLEFQRTAVFVRGIYKAVCKLREDFPSERIHILYAGCGPYATLLTPLVTLFTTAEIKFTFLDINQTSLDAAERLYIKLNLSDYVSEYVCADATTYNIPEETIVHLAVSETMLNALAREPQVAVMQNLMPQLVSKALFVPAKITVSANLLDSKEEQRAFTTPGSKPTRISLGELYTIGRTQYKSHQPVTFTIPNQIGDFKNLFLHTRIETYGDEVLTDYQCSLSYPKLITNAELKEGKRITLNYKSGESPGFVHQWE